MSSPNEETLLLGGGECNSSSRRSSRVAICFLLFAVVLLVTVLRQGWLKPVGVGWISRSSGTASVLPTILAVGDWGRSGRFAQRKVASALSRVAGDAKEVVIVSTGDNFYDTGVSSVLDKQFNTSYEEVYNVHGSLRKNEFWAVLGNHDHLGSVRAQIDYSRRSRTWNMPGNYYTKRVSDDLLLVFLDTTPYIMHDEAGDVARGNGFLGEVQTHWLKNVLANAGEPWFLVFGHHNMYSGSKSGHRGSKDLRHGVGRLLRGYGDRVLGYVSGHEHALMHLRVDGLDHFVSGGGSELDRVDLLGRKHNRAHWRKKWGVVRGKEAPFVRSMNGFFGFQFSPDSRVFDTFVYNKHAEIVYRYRKKVGPRRG